MTDSHEPRSILGMEIMRDKRNEVLTLSQENYISKMLERFGYSEMHPQRSPMITNQVANHNRQNIEDDETILAKLTGKNCNYRAIVDSLQYLTTKHFKRRKCAKSK